MTVTGRKAGFDGQERIDEAYGTLRAAGGTVSMTPHVYIGIAYNPGPLKDKAECEAFGGKYDSVKKNCRDLSKCSAARIELNEGAEAIKLAGRVTQGAGVGFAIAGLFFGPEFEGAGGVATGIGTVISAYGEAVDAYAEGGDRAAIDAAGAVLKSAFTDLIENKLWRAVFGKLWGEKLTDIYTSTVGLAVGSLADAKSACLN